MKIRWKNNKDKTRWKNNKGKTRWKNNDGRKLKKNSKEKKDTMKIGSELSAPASRQRLWPSSTTGFLELEASTPHQKALYAQNANPS